MTEKMFVGNKFWSVEIGEYFLIATETLTKERKVISKAKLFGVPWSELVKDSEWYKIERYHLSFWLKGRTYVHDNA